MKGRMLPVPLKARRRNEPRGRGAGMRAGNAARKVRSAEPRGRSTEAPRGKAGRKRRVSFGRARRVWTVDSGRFSPAFSPSARGGRNAGSLKRGAEESNSSEISLIRAAEARGKAGASEMGRSEDSRGAEPSRRGPCLGKNFRSGDCRRERLRLSLSCGTIFALSFMRGVFFRRAANFGVMRRPACLNAKRCVFPRV